MALKDTWIDRTTEDYVVPQTVNELAAAIIEIEKNGAGVIPTISVEEVNNGYVFIVDDGKGNVERVKVENGTAPYIGEDGYWYIGLSNTGIIADASKALENLDTAVATEDIKGGFMPMGGNAYNVAYGGEETIKLEIKATTSIDDLLTTHVDLVFPEGNWDIHVKHTGYLPVPIVFDIEGVKIYTDCTNLPSNSIREMIGKTDCFSDESIRISFSVLNRGDACSFDLYCVNHIEGKDGLMSSEDKGALTDLRSEVDQINSALPKDSKGNYKKVAAKEDVDNLSTQLIASTLKGAASGTIVAIKDVSPIEHEMGVKVRGKNLIPNPYPELTSNTTEINGVTINVNEDGTITINGTATADVALRCYSWNAVSLKAGAYTFSGGISQNVRVSFSGKTAQGEKLFDFTVHNTPSTQQLTKDMTQLYMAVRVTNGTVCENVTVRPMIEEGSVATAYAPYVGDISAVKLKAYEQNLLNIDAGVNGTSFVKNSDGTYTLTKQGGSRLTGKIPFVFPSTTFSMYAEIVDTNIEGLTGINAIVRNANGTITKYPKVYPDGRCTLIDTGGCSADIQLYIDGSAADGSYITFRKPQIAVSSTPITEYKPYVEPIEYSVSAEGTTKVTSIHPTATLCADTDGVIIDCTYNRDINIAFKQLEEKITALSAASI